MGFYNVTSILTYLIALDRLSGIVVFPVQAAGGLALNTLFAATVWKERFARRTQLGIGIAVVGLPPVVAFVLLGGVLCRLLPDKIKEGHCRNCEYDLTGNLSGTCPECGEAIEQA